jgi:hypothetical protein
MGVMTKQEFLAFSLPYGLKLFNKNCEHKRMYEMDGLFTPNAVHCKETNRVDYFHCEIMPILHPLSDLDSYNLNSPMNLTSNLALCFPYSLQRIIENRIATNTLSMVDALELIRHHFDISDLISKGEAIDVNILEINPYK